MDRLGNQFLARAALADDQHIGVGRADQSDLFKHPRNGGRPADDLRMVVAGADLLLEIGVFHFEALLQPVDFGERVAQAPLVLLALGDVAEDDHRPLHLSLVDDRRRGVFDPDRLAVLAPEQFVLDPVDLGEAESVVDRAVLDRIAPAVGVCVVDEIVHGTADEVFGPPAEHALGRRVGEGRPSLDIDAVDALAGGRQDQLADSFGLVEQSLASISAARRALSPRSRA